MDGLYDYILWMGDYPFSATGFHEVDAIVLCTLAYFDLSPVFRERGPAHVRDCQRMIDEGSVRVMITGKDTGYAEILAAAAASKRFGDLLLSDYVDIVRPEVPVQFSAVTFHDDAGLSFLAYRGTDSTLAGWKEDCMIGFTHTEAQELAKQYAEKHLIRGRRWYMGGHSKGGNLALYAACTISDKRFSRLRRVFLLDCPGFCPEVMDADAVRRVDPVATRIVPGFSVVGKLFEPDIRDTRIIRSSASGLAQHGIASWGVDHGKLARLTEHEPNSVRINEILRKWIDNMSREDRVVFVNELFDALEASGAETLEELTAEGFRGNGPVMQHIQGASEITRRIIADLPRQAMLSALGTLQQRVEEKAAHLPAMGRQEKKAVK